MARAETRNNIAVRRVETIKEINFLPIY